jgi:TonB family protein
VKGSLTTKPVKFLSGEIYKRAPVVKYRINEDGTVSNVRLVRSSGLKNLDRQVIKAVASWKYKPNPGCPIEAEMSLTIDWH